MNQVSVAPRPYLSRPDPDVDQVCRQIARLTPRDAWHNQAAHIYQDTFLEMQGTPVLVPPETAMPLEALWHPLLRKMTRVTDVVRLPPASSPEAEKKFRHLDLAKDLLQRCVVTPCLPGYFDIKTDVPEVCWRSSVALLAEKAMHYETGKMFVTEPVYAVLMEPRISPSYTALSRMRFAHDNSFLVLSPRNSIVRGQMPLTAFQGCAIDYFFPKACPKVLTHGVEQVLSRYHVGLMTPGKDCITVSTPDWDNPAGWCATIAWTGDGIFRRCDALPGQAVRAKQAYDRRDFPIKPQVIVGRSLPIAHGKEETQKIGLLRQLYDTVRQIEL